MDFDDFVRRCDATFPSLNDAERRIAIAVHRTMAASGPAAVADIARDAEVTPIVVERRLASWPGVYRDDSGRIVGFWGLSTQPTDHRLEVGGRTLYGWCAWDTLFLPEILGVPGRVSSRCPATDNLITLRVESDGPKDVNPRQAVVSLLNPDRADVAGNAVISSFCHHIRFLTSPEAWDDWARNTDNGTFMVTVSEAWELGRKVNRLRYGELTTVGDDGS